MKGNLRKGNENGVQSVDMHSGQKIMRHFRDLETMDIRNMRYRREGEDIKG